MKKYPKYKDSGIDWIGEIPAHWAIKRMKSIFQECVDVSCTGKEDLLSVSEYYGVARRLDKMEEGEYETRADSLIGYKICKKGDLVINIMLAWKRGLGFSDYDGIVSPAYSVYRGDNIEPHYYHYLMRTNKYVAEYKRNSKGIIDSRLRMYTDRFNNIQVIVPPIEEQRAIAAYLDKKCGAIDGQVELLEKKRKAYERLKTSIINNAVTRGLNTDAPMRDSGIDWIGKIPSHWCVSRIKDVADIFAGATPSSKMNSYWDGDVIWVTPADMTDFGYIEQGSTNISELGYNSCGTHLVPAGSIILSSRAPIGKVNIANKSLCTNQGCKSLVLKNGINGKYLAYYLYNECSNIDACGQGTTFKELSLKNLVCYKILFPPIEEQRAIATYLDEKCGEIDITIENIGKQIDAYKRLKRALINEVVTGKRAV